VCLLACFLFSVFSKVSFVDSCGMQMTDQLNCLWQLVVLMVTTNNIQGYSKRSIHFQKFILQKLLMLNPCPVHGWKGNLSNFWSESPARCQVRTQFCPPRRVMWSVGRAGLLIWHLPRHTWGSHRVLVRCENNFESSPFILYIARRHMFNSTCKIDLWKCILFLITLYY
jgi:hypothetical protein